MKNCHVNVFFRELKFLFCNSRSFYLSCKKGNSVLNRGVRKFKIHIVGTVHILFWIFQALDNLIHKVTMLKFFKKSLFFDLFFSILQPNIIVCNSLINEKAPKGTTGQCFSIIFKPFFHQLFWLPRSTRQLSWQKPIHLCKSYLCLLLHIFSLLDKCTQIGSWVHYPKEIPNLYLLFRFQNIESSIKIVI